MNHLPLSWEVLSRRAHALHSQSSRFSTGHLCQVQTRSRSGSPDTCRDPPVQRPLRERVMASKPVQVIHQPHLSDTTALIRWASHLVLHLVPKNSSSKELTVQCRGTTSSLNTSQCTFRSNQNSHVSARLDLNYIWAGQTTSLARPMKPPVFRSALSLISLI